MFMSVGDTLTNMSVLALPPRESLINIVNLWFLHSTTSLQVTKACSNRAVTYANAITLVMNASLIQN